MEEVNELITQRRQKLATLKEEGINPYPNDFTPDTLTDEIQEKFGSLEGEKLNAVAETFSLAGRIMSKRVMGKASFINIQDRKGRLQIFVKRDALGEESYSQFKKYDIGDFVGVSGRVFKTKVGELSINADGIRLLVKSLRNRQ